MKKKKKNTHVFEMQQFVKEKVKNKKKFTLALFRVVHALLFLHVFLLTPLQKIIKQQYMYIDVEKKENFFTFFIFGFVSFFSEKNKKKTIRFKIFILLYLLLFLVSKKKSSTSIFSM